MSKSVGISVRTVVPPGTPMSMWLSILGCALDRLLGISAINAMYQRGLEGLSPFEFATRSLQVLDVSVTSSCANLTDRVPSTGPLLIICNHPYGGIEALILASALGPVRRDVKILANTALRVFPELRSIIIPINPLKVSQKNLVPIRQCAAHLEDGGVLIVFPAGKVSFYQEAKKRIADGDWNRIVGYLALCTETPLMPIFFHGCNSRVFHILGRLWDRSKLLMLPRELLKLKGRTISFSVGRVVPPRVWRNLSIQTLTGYARTITYLQESEDVFGNEVVNTSNSATRDTKYVPAVIENLAPHSSIRWMTNEVAALPKRQKLLDFKHYSVYYANASQIPTVMAEIARERERVFRVHDEGSGQARDSDEYDNTYVQLWIWDNVESSIVGAYRMGRTDVLKSKYGKPGLYLSQMFDFDDAFHADNPPMLELGRSFVVPEHQKSFHALYLLWQGIGRYLVAHPQYRRVYGTVSLSRQYDDRAIALLCDALIEPSPHIRALHPLTIEVHPEVRDFFNAEARELKTLAALVRGLDADGKDLPVLVKHYMKLGARFLCVGVDPNFNNTPGLLLELDVPALAPRALSTFFGDGAPRYLAYSPEQRASKVHHLIPRDERARA